MSSLTAERIGKLASRRGVDRIAVVNFLSTIAANKDAMCAWGNADADARSYRWSPETLAAIREGITEHFGAR